MTRRTDPQTGDAALQDWARATTASPAEAISPPRSVLAPAVRRTLELFAAEHPGGAVELRVPPFAAVQALPGTRHTRGTPPAVVETDAMTWLALVVGDLTWAQAVAEGHVRASGERSDLSDHLPLPGPRRTVRTARAGSTPTTAEEAP